MLFNSSYSSDNYAQLTKSISTLSFSDFLEILSEENFSGNSFEMSITFNTFVVTLSYDTSSNLITDGIRYWSINTPDGMLDYDSVQQFYYDLIKLYA